MQINKLYRTVIFNRDWHKINSDEASDTEMAAEYTSLMSDEKTETPGVQKHDSDIEEEKEDEGDIIEGNNILYDTTVVDDVPKLPSCEDGNSFSVAPGEGKIPISRLSENLDQLAFPDIFPQAECGFHQSREVPLSLGQYYNSLTWRQDSRCTRSTFIFHAQSQKEKQQLQSTINFQSKNLQENSRMIQMSKV